MQLDLMRQCPHPCVFLDLVLTTKTPVAVQSVGIGAMAMTPIIGSLSDNYGRKPLLTITCAANILPLGNNSVCSRLLLQFRTDVPRV